jgi:hypothetical protein
MSLRRLFGRQAPQAEAPPVRVCGACRSFNNDPHYLEAQMPGLRSLSSATSSVRTDDGLCARHGRYLGARSSCADFQAR